MHLRHSAAAGKCHAAVADNEFGFFKGSTQHYCPKQHPSFAHLRHSATAGECHAEVADGGLQLLHPEGVVDINAHALEAAEGLFGQPEGGVSLRHPVPATEPGACQESHHSQGVRMHFDFALLSWLPTPDPQKLLSMVVSPFSAVCQEAGYKITLSMLYTII